MRKRLCRWLYRHGFVKLAYRVSPSMCGYFVGRDIQAGITEALCEE